MTEKKTAEEIVSKNDTDKGPPHWVTKKSAIKSCEEYAAQELAEYKARLKELIKERIDKHENNFYDNVNDSHAFGKLSECRYLLELTEPGY